jgi:myo-inositol-hexaphosphate 3-phosphohydrolase
MKLVIIFCVKAFYKELKQIYNAAGIDAYSEFDVRGFTNKRSGKCEAPNWFASSKDHYDSIATFSFLDQNKGDVLMKQIEEFNKGIDCCSPIHAYMLDVEKFI